MKLKLTALLFMLHISALMWGQLYTYQNFAHRQGLNMASINCTFQTEDGYLWIGTDGGALTRYNGTQFEEIKLPEGQNNHHVTDFFESGRHILFTSKYRGGFLAFHQDSNSLTRLKVESKDLGEARCFLKAGNHYYLIGNGGVAETKSLTKTAKVITRFPRKLAPFKVHNYFVLNDVVYLFTSSGNFRLKDGKIIPLNDWINLDKATSDQLHFGHAYKNKLYFMDSLAANWVEITLDQNNTPVSTKRHSSPNRLNENEYLISYHFNERLISAVALSNQGRIFKIKDRKPHTIAHNYSESISDPVSVFCDFNGDYWVSTSSSGLYKVSLEPFTRIQLHPIFEHPEIMFPYKTIFNDVFIGVEGGKSYVGKMEENATFTPFDFQIKGATIWQGTYYVATNLGIKEFVPGPTPSFKDIAYNNQNTNFIKADKTHLWIGVSGKGVIRLDPTTLEVKEYRKTNKNIPEYFYTAQVHNSSSQLYFGTNSGIYRFNKVTEEFKQLPVKELGSYSGVSTTDVYGTCWFTLDLGLVGITNQGDIKMIYGKDHFSTNLFFTLTSDRLGNLIVGTNKGLDVLKVNRHAEITSQTHYDATTGFSGYETHMRSQFESDNSMFIGTVEGLFLINTDILDQLRKPLPPIISDRTRYDINGESKENSFHYTLNVNNPKQGRVKFYYRLLGQSEEWIPAEEDNSIHLYNLKNGKYTLEVKATYDDNIFSKISKKEFIVQMPIWRTDWFVILIIFIIVGVNIILLYYSKSFDTSQLLRSKDTEVHIRLAPAIILFGSFAVVGAYVGGPLINSQLELHLGATLSIGFILLTLYFLSRTASQSENGVLVNRYLITAVFIVVVYCYYELYVSNLHPYHILALTLSTMILPYFLPRIKMMIITSVVLVMLGLILAVIIDNPVYPKGYFLMALGILVCLLVFSSYLRFDSIEKLIFISGIINRGNIPAIAFNEKGTILYVSENISLYTPTNHEQLVHKDISTLNNYVPFEGQFREVDVLKAFRDGQKYLVPMANKEGKVHWLEWEYKEFSSSIKVMLGQDVTARMELENTYELLVQNAEDFIYQCDIEGNFVFMNKVCFEKLGYSKQELIGQSSLSIVPDSHFEATKEHYSEHFNRRRDTSYLEFPITKKNGEIIWIGQYVTTIYAAGSNNYITGFIALARDITEIRQQQQLIREQRDDITASINYAQRIQLNLLPHERNFASSFKEHLIIYKPKDIVSGDFYWMERVDNKIILALADCTGHGVPGSFMTLLGINLLNSVVLENKITDPGTILNELDKRLMDSLPRTPGSSAMNDGMEISVCVFDDESQEMSFACAGARFLIYDNGAFTMFKGDVKHIGDIPHPDFNGFSTHYVNFTSDQNLYLFTDGFQDQFGGPHDKKFSFRRILELLEDIGEKPLIDQREIIEKEFDDWTGNGDQTDDLTIISIRRNII